MKNIEQLDKIKKIQEELNALVSLISEKLDKFGKKLGVVRGLINRNYTNVLGKEIELAELVTTFHVYFTDTYKNYINNFSILESQFSIQLEVISNIYKMLSSSNTSEKNYLEVMEKVTNQLDLDLKSLSKIFEKFTIFHENLNIELSSTYPIMSEIKKLFVNAEENKHNLLTFLQKKIHENPKYQIEERSSDDKENERKPSPKR